MFKKQSNIKITQSIPLRTLDISKVSEKEITVAKWGSSKK